jgi:hypothetical protein
VKKSIAIVIASLGLGLLTLGGIASCKQGEGERCQIQADCEGDLQCNVAQGICVSSSQEMPIDAMPDTPPMPIDAAIDAPDAM